MSKKQNKKPKGDNVQEKLNSATNSVSNGAMNQNHNTKKESLGPNTNR